MPWTHEQKLHNQRLYRQRTQNLHTKNYEHSLRGHLMRTYRNMLSRVTGIQYKKAHIYKGLALLPRREFYAISFSDPDYLRLFIQWKDSKYDQKLTPSINRVDPAIGYENFNVEWLTHSENSRLGAFSKHAA